VTIKHIYWFAYYGSVSPSTRSRGELPLKVFLEKYDITHSIVYPGYGFKNIIHFISVYLEVLFFRDPCSLLVIQKIYSNRLYATALKFLLLIRKKHSLYDIDDAEYLRHAPGSVNFFMKHCTFVSVGSKALEIYAQRFNSNVLLNTSPVANHHYFKNSLAEKFTIGWVGDYGNGNGYSYAFSHKRGLNELVFPIIKKLGIPFRLVLIGINKAQDIKAVRNFFAEMENIELIIPENIDWTDEDWLYQEICKFDIGLAPLIDHEFNQAKSAYKVKQYLSCGVPVLASSVGENVNFILQGINGFLYDLPGEYASQINHFAGIEKDKYFEMSKIASGKSYLFRTEKYCENLINYLAMIN
jgi:glycosyltransferase involved in cell wall biosynthesis